LGRYFREMEVGLAFAASVAIGAWSVAAPNRREQLLLTAAREGCVADIENLLESGLGIDAPGSAGETALHLAAANGRTAVVNLLLSLGADPMVRTTAPLADTVSLAGAASRTAAHAAAAAGHHAALSALLEHDTSALAVSDAGGDTCLHLACANGHEAVAELLLRRQGVDAQSTTTGATPLAVAAGLGLLPVVQLCLAYGSAVDTADWEGNTPLHWACVGMHSAVCECLCSAGASLHAQNKNGQGETPLGLAYQPGHAAMDKMRRVLRETLVKRSVNGDPEVSKARAAQERLEARLVALARDDPTTLIHLLQDAALQATIIRLRADISLIPKCALEYCDQRMIRDLCEQVSWMNV